MTPAEKQAVLTLCLLAAFADGHKHDRERDQIRQVMDSLGSDIPPGLFQQVLLRKPLIAEVVQPLTTPELRQLAYEWAVCVCEAQGSITPPERDFLNELGRALRLDDAHGQTVEQQASTLDSRQVATLLRE